MAQHELGLGNQKSDRAHLFYDFHKSSRSWQIENRIRQSII